MPKLNPDSGFNEQAVANLRHQLQKLDLQAPVVFSKAERDWYIYFETFGFNRLSSACDYYLGTVSAGQRILATHVWLHPEPKGGVFVAHGLFDHVGLFLDLIEGLLQEGFSVLAFDFPGHGLSEGEPATIEDFNQYGELIGECITQVVGQHPRMPSLRIAVGQSTGCAAIMNYVLVHKGRAFEQLIFLAPLIKPKGYFWINIAYLLLHKFLRFVPRSFAQNSHDQEFIDFLANKDPMQSRNVSVTWIGAMRQWTRNFDELEPAAIDTFIYQGDADTTVDWEDNIPRIKRKLNVLDTVIIAGAMHHLVKEADDWRQPMLERIRSKISDSG